MNINIWVIDHRFGLDRQDAGKIITIWPITDEDSLGPRYADFNALHEVWQYEVENLNPPSIVGFFGYRKYLWSRMWHHIPSVVHSYAPEWYQADPLQFDAYRQFLSEWDGDALKPLLAQHDILQAPPFPLNVNMITDLALTRSEHDADVLRDTMRKHGWYGNSGRIYPYLFITRWAVFDRMMREVEPLRLELDQRIMPYDSTNPEYEKRPMAYIMERLYSEWLQKSKLDIKEIPLLHCWELKE